MTKKVLIAVSVLTLVLALGLLVVISLQPGNFVVERSATIAAPAKIVFSQVNDLAAWNAWSPWKDLDPNAKTTMSSPSTGTGATFSWDGNDQIGAGQLTIFESHPDERVEVEQEFFRPFAGKALMIFTLSPEGAGTRLTWKMSVANDFFGKAMCLFMDMDALVGKNFEQGLASIKQITEHHDASPTP